jgi:hypothetical protein
MPDAPNTPPAKPAPKKPRAKPGFIDQDLEDAIDLADACHREAAKPDVAAELLKRTWTAADQQALGDSLGRCAAFKSQIKTARTGKSTRGDEEEIARQALLIALDPILKGARRTYPDRSAERKAYGIGGKIPNTSAGDLLTLAAYASSQLAPSENNTPPKDVLKGVLPAEIAAVGSLVAKYRQADWAQGDAQRAASQLLVRLRQEIETTLNPIRRDCQGAADQAYTHRNPLHAAQRKAFGLQPDRPLND